MRLKPPFPPTIRKDSPTYSDLKLIDELLCDLKGMRTGTDWRDVEEFSSVTRYAMNRLRTAWRSGEMQVLTKSLAEYFKQG